MSDHDLPSILAAGQAEVTRQVQREGQASVSVTATGETQTAEGSVQATWKRKTSEWWLKVTGHYTRQPGPDGRVIKGEFGGKW